MLEYLETTKYLEDASDINLRALPPEMKLKIYEGVKTLLSKKTGHSEASINDAAKWGLDAIFDPEQFQKMGFEQRIAASAILSEFHEKPDPVDFFLWGVEKAIANGNADIRALCRGILYGEQMQWPEKLRELPDEIKRQVYESAKPILAKCAGQSWEKYEKNSRRFLHAVFTEKDPKWNPDGDPNDKDMLELERRVVQGIRKEFATEPAFIDYMLWQLETLIADGRVKLGMVKSPKWDD